MSFSIEPKERDYRLKINGIGYQTLSVADCRYLIDDLKKNPYSVDLKGVKLVLRHNEEKCAELRTLLGNATGIKATLDEEIVEPIVYPFSENEDETFVDEEEE